MDRKQPKLNDAAKKFIKKLHADFNPVKIILFGSRARGDALAYSDYDFIVVSDKFENVHWLERISKVISYWNSDLPIDILPYTLQEFKLKKRSSSVVNEAVKQGLEV